jgi:hypothetical protein
MSRKGFLVLICLLLASWTVRSAQTSDTASRTRALLEQLSSPDHGRRDAARSELIKAPNPDSLPALLKALADSNGELRSALIDILEVYKDPRKIPALIRAARPYTGDPNDVKIGNQLSELGTPAAHSLMNSLPTKCDESDVELTSYTSWVADVIGHTNPWSLPALFAGLHSGNACGQRAGQEGLQICCARPEYGLGDPDIILFTSAVLSDDERIRSAADLWIDSFHGDYGDFEFAGIIEILITAYQKNAPPETMIGVARLLASDPCSRVTRFMRAALNAPNPKIQQIAHEYLAKNHRTSAPG